MSAARIPWAVLAVALALLLALLVQLQDLSTQVDALRREQEARPTAGQAADAPSAARPELAPQAGPMLEAPAPAAQDEAAAARARLEALERQLAALAGRLEASERERARMEQVLAASTEGLRSQNEAAAFATARNVISALAQVQATSRIDEDGDRVGEFGGFVEMSGAAAGRMAQALVPPVLSSAFRTLTEAGEARRSGYLYRIYLPDARGQGVGEPSAGFAPGMVSADLAETTWCLYAWPEVQGVTGTRTFFTSQAGDVLWCESAAYSGSGRGPAPEAVFKPGGRGGITGVPALGTTGTDGNLWRQGG
jgi:hypothetical protein